MIRKILAIILDVSFLTFILKLSKHYDTKNIDILSLFDTFSGVSSGSILASAFVLREQFLQNVATSSPDIIESALKKINPDYSDNDITKTIKNLKRMKIANCSSNIILILLNNIRYFRYYD